MNTKQLLLSRWLKTRRAAWAALGMLVLALAACSGAPAAGVAAGPTDNPAAPPADAAGVPATAMPQAMGAGPAMTPGQGVGPAQQPLQGMGPGQARGQGFGPGNAPGQGMGQGWRHREPGHGPGQGFGPGNAPGQGMGQGWHQGEPGHGPGQGFGPGNPWREFHRQPVPSEFAGLTNPVPADEASIARGEAIYQQQCAACHGPTGLGDGDAAATLDPPPAPLARTAQKMDDAYLYWRIHEGGAAFGTAMPAYGAVLSEDQIWDVVNYLRSLSAGPATVDQAAMQAAMLAQAVEQGVLTQDEADLFQRLHEVVEAYKDAHWDELRAQAGGDPDAMLDLMLQGLVDQGTITPDEADAFRDIHQRLHDAGLMP